MAVIPNDEQFHAVSGDVNTQERGSALQNSRVASYTMADITQTVILNGGGGGLAGSGTQGFLSRWTSPTQLGDSDIERTAVYSTPNGGQYELRGNLKIFGESNTSGVGALFIEDNTNARVEIRDVDNATGNILSELELVASDNFVTIGTPSNVADKPMLINRNGSSKFRFGTETKNGVTYDAFGPTSGTSSLGGTSEWVNIFFNPPAYADDAAAGAGGLGSDQVYQTDGTGAAPLNVAGILMVKQ